jgi:hypothetical protein
MLPDRPVPLDQKMRKPAAPNGATGFLGEGEIGSELGLEVFAGAEFHGFGGFDFDAFSGLRVDAEARFAVDDFECAEADELHHFAPAQVGFDALDDGIDCTFGVGLGAVEFFLDGFDEFDFVHWFGVAGFCLDGTVKTSGEAFPASRRSCQPSLRPRAIFVPGGALYLTVPGGV